MQQTPPTVPLPDRSAQRRPRTSFYVTVGCLSVIAGLLLGVGGFVGVRALQGGGAPLGGGESAGAAPEPAMLEEAPVGPDSAVPLGSTFPIESTLLEGEVGVTPAAVDWEDRERARLNSSHVAISYAVACLTTQKGMRY